jgi:prepilin-type N-terminal cleavage/methylation domain-containing protein
MIKRMQKKNSEEGFTLLEVIITITIGAILASILVAFMGTAITQSSDPVKQVRDLGVSGGVLETANADYSSYLSSGTPDWTTFKTNTCTGGNIACTTVLSGSGIYNSGFETIQVTVTSGSQKIVSYFMQ